MQHCYLETIIFEGHYPPIFLLYSYGIYTDGHSVQLEAVGGFVCNWSTHMEKLRKI